ncbi:MAG TPA: GNAT family N-acetyltransferase [Chlamydiales bacterium]|nr:GNAT family N-acetyltransferase [Chlamydiales bacterium]
MTDSREFNVAFDANVKHKFSYLPGKLPNMAVTQKNGMLIVDGGLNTDMFNIICCDGANDREVVHLAIDHFKAKKLPYAFWVGFENDPSWLEEELLSMGLTVAEIDWAMVCDLQEHPPVLSKLNLDIRQVGDQSAVRDIITVMNRILPAEEHRAIESFYLPSVPYLLDPQSLLIFFVGYYDDKPVSISSSFCDRGMVSIFDVIVSPEMRGKGFGKAMTLQPMIDAQAKGYDKVVLTATDDVRYLYEKIGFHVFKTMKVYHEYFSI